MTPASELQRRLDIIGETLKRAEEKAIRAVIQDPVLRQHHTI